MDHRDARLIVRALALAVTGALFPVGLQILTSTLWMAVTEYSDSTFQFRTAVPWIGKGIGMAFAWLASAAVPASIWRRPSRAAHLLARVQWS